MAVHWQPAQAIFGTVDLRAEDWLLSVAVASSVLLLDEARKLVLRLLGGARR
jgi:Ca2+-transporting ATPase